MISRGNLYVVLQKWKEAKDDFKAVLKLEPKSGAAYMGVAECEAQLKNNDAAILAYSEAISIDPNIPAISKTE